MLSRAVFSMTFSGMSIVYLIFCIFITLNISKSTSSILVYQPLTFVIIDYIKQKLWKSCNSKFRIEKVLPDRRPDRSL